MLKSLADASGKANSTAHGYDPYGTWGVPLGGSTGNALRFQSRRFDVETSFYYFRNRMMSPVLGRFIQRDPLGHVDGMNLYDAFRGGSRGSIGPLRGNFLWRHP